jgi:DNA-binding Lrp family transcriptional regulator
MAKNSKKQIKEDERRILTELQKNANKSINEIAKKCKFSRQKVWRIIKNLEKNNTIWGYMAVIDEEKIEMKAYSVLIKRSNQPLSKELVDNIIERNLENNIYDSNTEIISSSYTNGIFDWIICFRAKDIREAKRFCESLNTLFKGYIQEIYLLEKMFPVKKCGISNPEIKKLNDFFNL